MHGFFSIKRAERQPPRHHSPYRSGQRRPSQSGEEAGAGSLPPERQSDCLGMGHRGESAPGSGANAFCYAGTGTDEAVPANSAAFDCTAAAGKRSRGFVKTAVLALIGFYRSSLSPAIRSSCRFYPTCSGYAYEAVSTWGVRRGLRLALGRVLRCRPFGGYGCDPVPGREEHPGASQVVTAVTQASGADYLRSRGFE
jgi:putative membrane protein insertion efficiency factor